jgi:hypothetical protein
MGGAERARNSEPVAGAAMGSRRRSRTVEGFETLFLGGLIEKYPEFAGLQPVDVLGRDALAGPLLAAATGLMQGLTSLPRQQTAGAPKR